jgi:type II secretory pathway pseudopilin PulG
MKTKVKSFTLAEMLVVIIITAIVVGMAFSVLRLVQRQVTTIEKNFSTTTSLVLFEQQLWQDFATHNNIVYNDAKLKLYSDTDTVLYSFKPDYTTRNTDTLNAKLAVNKTYYVGRQVKSGYIDALEISGKELPGYTIFVSMQPDAAHYMNNDGF